jgi:hypothetical protein
VNPDASSILFTTLSPFLFLAQQPNNYCFFIIHRRLMNADTHNSGKTAVPALKPGNGKARRALLCLSVRGYENAPCTGGSVPLVVCRTPVNWFRRHQVARIGCLPFITCSVAYRNSNRPSWLKVCFHGLAGGGGVSERLSEFLLQEFEETARSKVWKIQWPHAPTHIAHGSSDPAPSIPLIIVLLPFQHKYSFTFNNLTF